MFQHRFELLSNVSICLATADCLLNFSGWQAYFIIAVFSFYLCGYFAREGVRIQAILVFACFLPYAICFFICGGANTLFLKILAVLAFTANAVNNYWCLTLGSGDLATFNKLMNGKYEVGVRHFTSKIRKQSCLVFYPADHSDQYEN
jgi:hypothetical protein